MFYEPKDCVLKVIEYDIWKITGAGRKGSRYYESEKQFNRYGKAIVTDYSGFYKVKVFRFTSEGWKELEL